jgi:uncharacterized protein (DUF2062 family)
MSSWSARGIRDVFLFQTIRFFRLRGTPEKLARGFAIGLACSFYPTFGFGGFLAAFLARVLGGNLVAGFVGGTVLAFVWPLVFFLNIQTGGLFLRPPIVVDDLEDVTEQTVNALVWGQTFALGAAINSLVAAVAAYLVFLLVFERIRPSALNWLRQRVRNRKPA